MTPPMNTYTSNGTRRVEFSGLPTIDSGAPEETQTHAWDSETDHLLSYFLSDQSGQSGPAHSQPGVQYQEYASMPSHSNDMNPPLGTSASYGPGSSRTSSNSTLTEAPEPPQPRTPHVQFYHPGRASHSTTQPQQQPQQPAYGTARQTAENTALQQAQSQLISSSSSSSLSSMVSSLVGGPVALHQMHHPRHHSQAPPAPPGNHPGTNDPSGSNKPRGNSDSPPHDDSPISPAAMIGTGHENLMLPPPSRRQHRNGGHGAPGPTHPPKQGPPFAQHSMAKPQQQQPHYANPQIVYQTAPGQTIDPSNNNAHMKWLDQLNARAKATNPMTQPLQPGQPATIIHPPGTLVSIHGPGQPPVVAQHPGAMTMPAANGTAHVFHAGTFPTAAAAAAAVAQNPILYQAALNHKFHMAAQSSQGESEEKRARRLERNRESARKSRRRKKERLATLSAQVDRLHTQIEDERRNQVNAMCDTLKKVRKDEFANLFNDVNENADQLNTHVGRERLAAILMSSSGGSPIARSCTEFQYNTLRQVLLPRYQKFLLWLTLHNDTFFIAGKDEYTRKDGKQVLRVSSGRVSSKQIGDELTNGWKTEKSDGKKKNKADAPDLAERSNPTSRALDAPRMWPLLCFELSISVDQEERLLQALKRLQQMENLANYRSQLAAATKLTTNLTEAISSQCQVSVAREDRSFLGILTPAQAAKFHGWMAANKEWCSRLLGERRPPPEKCNPVFKDSALVEVCKRLEEVLRISKKEQDFAMESRGQV